jgi:hypothetical protein
VEDEVRVIPKMRRDDFIDELRHIEQCCDSGEASPLDLQWGIETLQVITAAHESQQSGRSVDLSSTLQRPLEPQF